MLGSYLFVFLPLLFNWYLQKSHAFVLQAAACCMADTEYMWLLSLKLSRSLPIIARVGTLCHV